MVLIAIGLPTNLFILIFPVDFILDRMRTTVNVHGDSIGACVVEKLCEKQLKEGQSKECRELAFIIWSWNGNLKTIRCLDMRHGEFTQGKIHFTTIVLKRRNEFFLDLTKWLNSFYCTYFLSSTITFYHSGIASNARKRFVISFSPDCFSKTFPHYFYHVSCYDVLRHLNRSIEFWLTGFIAFSHPNNPPPEWDSGLWNFTNPWPENAQSTISSIILEV